MKLTIQNINKIEFAEIKVNGLTVIAGTNDSGKSTVGKTLFSVVKALANSTDNSKAIDDTLNRKLDTLYGSLLELDDFYKTSLNSRLSLRNTFRRLKMQKESGATIQRLEQLADTVENSEFNPSHKASINRQISEIKALILEGNTPGCMLKREMQAILEAEFMKSVCSYDTDSSEILFSDESGNEDFLVKLSQDRITELSGGNKCFFEDVTLIESPLYLHLIDVLSSARTFNEERNSNDAVFMRFVPQVNYHIKDIAQKLYNFRFSVANKLFQEDGSGDIDTITGGHFGFDEDNKRLFWEKDQRRFQVVNVASGIKSFGMMQMLESINCINEKRILIWDEPENHLHPEWQIKLAELLVGMAKKGIPILITSHSPYFIQAIRYFSNKMEMDKFVVYYMADETSQGTCRMTEYTDDLNTIFYKLAEPMNRIINLGR